MCSMGESIKASRLTWLWQQSLGGYLEKYFPEGTGANSQNKGLKPKYVINTKPQKRRLHSTYFFLSIGQKGE